MPPLSASFKVLLATACVPLIWGTTYLTTTELLPPDRPITAAFLRVFPAGLFLIFWKPWWPTGKMWLKLALLSLLNISLFQALLFVAAYRLPGGVAALAGALQPLIVMALIASVEKIPPKAASVIAGIVGVLGMAALLLRVEVAFDQIGLLAALLGAFLSAAGTYFVRRWKVSAPLVPFTAWQLILGGLTLLPAALYLEPALPALGFKEIAGYAYLSVFGGLIAYVLWFRGIYLLPTVAVSALTLISPLIAALLGLIFLKQNFTPLSWLGFFTVLLSVLVLQWVNRQK